MKIGILTFHRPINYGAILQATALQEYLNIQEKNAIIIDYRHPRIEHDRKLIGSRYSKERSLYANIRSLIRDIIEYSREKQLHDKFDEFLKKHIRLTEKCDNNESLEKVSNEVNTLLVGSDLVWNWEIDSELNEVFFLQFAKKFNGYKASYASSIGSSKIPGELKTKYSKYLEIFDTISVREENAKRLLQPMTDKNIEVVLDPTLLLDSLNWERFEEDVNAPDMYILVYLLESSSDIIDIVSHIVKVYNLPIVFFDRFNVYKCKGKCMHLAGPGQFLTLIKNAQIVITNSFHGAVFSVLYKRQFFCIPHSSRGSRMIDLLNKLELSNRISRNVNDVEKELHNDIDFETTEKKLQEYRDKSTEYLKRIMENEK